MFKKSRGSRTIPAAGGDRHPIGPRTTVSRLIPTKLGVLIAVLASAGMVASGSAAATPGADAPQTFGGANWVGAWSATPMAALGPDNTLGTPLTFTNQTLRQIIHPHISGDTARIRLSNRYGTVPVTFRDVYLGQQVPGTDTLPAGLGVPPLPTSVTNFPGQLVSAATLAGAVQGAAVVPGSNKPVTFAGAGSITIAPGQDAYSDPIAFPVQALHNLVVSFYLPTFTGAATQHTIGNQINYLALGDVSNANPVLPIGSAPFVPNGISYYFLSGVNVVGGLAARTVVSLGDSITDGLMSTINANHRYPDALARRLQASPYYRDVSVLNEGVAGQRVLYDNIGPSTLHSLDLNVLSRPDVKYVIVESGINDLANPPFIGIPGRHPEPISAQQVIDGMQQIIDDAHAHGVKVYATTITPSGNLANPARGLFETYSLPEVVAKRHAVNDWIRTSGAADAVIDFDALLRDPLNPDSLNPVYASVDNLHPNDAGYALMGNSINLSLFN